MLPSFILHESVKLDILYTGEVTVVTWPHNNNMSSIITYPKALAIDQQTGTCYIVHGNKISKLYIPYMAYYPYYHLVKYFFP